ncbi:hypothetical protein [Kalamiella sp. sgz302252]|uniref:OB-fold protein n=1 Tax=Pantoea sp. sgz302252 TaxID=3341827 RepID=UPI0036D3A54A
MKKVIKWIFFIFVALVVIRAITGPGEGNKTTAQAGQSADAAENAPPQKEVYRVSAAKLFKDYEENEVATDEGMKGKLIAVTGTVQSIDKDFSDSIIIRLKTANQFMPASMQMLDSEKNTALTLKKGSQIEVVCQRMARVVGTPSGRRCVFN